MPTNIQRLYEINAQIKNLEHEKSSLETKIQNERTPYDKYLDTYAGKRLLSEHSLTEKGIWRIFGEDPNCEMGGSHHQPDLGLYEGRLIRVIKHAVELPGFWQWGGGGRIEVATLPVITKL